MASGDLREATGTPGGARWPRGKLAVASLAAGALALITCWNIDLAAQQRLAMLRAEIGTLVLRVAPPPVPERQNAALVYQRAVEMLRERPATEEERDSGGGESRGPVRGWDSERFDDWTLLDSTGFDPNDAALRKCLEIQAPTIALLLEGASRPECSFEHDYYWPSLGMLLPELIHVRDSARLLVLDARVRAADGDTRLALERLNAVGRMADHYAREPIIVNVLVALALDEMAIGWIARILEKCDASEELLQLVDPGEREASCRGRLRQAFRMEEAFGLAGICDFATGGTPELSSEVAHAGLWPAHSGMLYRIFLLPEDLDAYRFALGSYQDLLLLPFDKAQWIEKDVEGKLEAGPRGVLTAMVAPALSRCLWKAYEGDARRACLAAYIAILRAHARSGVFPETLDSIAPADLEQLPIDPFSGGPLLYRRTGGDEGDGFVVYSVGPDGKDDRGAEYDREQETGDVALRARDR